MFEIYLPIAELPVNIFAVGLLGIITGVLSGMFGVGGGFLTTPFLIFMGIPPAVAVASAANQIIATSTAGFLAHKRNVDLHIGSFLLAGGILGSAVGIWIFDALTRHGQIDIVIAVSYVVLLGAVGGSMLRESYKEWRRPASCDLPGTPNRFLRTLRGMPWQVRFEGSRISISAFLPLITGFLVGILVSLLGVGGGFLLIPAMIYLMGMPTRVVIGTSLFQIIFVTIIVTFLQAVINHTVDVVLAALLLVGSVFGAKWGMRLGAQLPAQQLKAMLAALVLAVALKLAYNLLIPPSNIYSIEIRQ